MQAEKELASSHRCDSWHDGPNELLKRHAAYIACSETSSFKPVSPGVLLWFVSSLPFSSFKMDLMG